MRLMEWLPGEAPELQPPLPDGLGADLASRLCVNQLWGRLLCLSPLLLRNYLFIYLFMDVDLLLLLLLMSRTRGTR